jgi:hypothetical protein
MIDAPQKRERGRPRFVPTDEQRVSVEWLAALGVPLDIIAASVINPLTNKPVRRDTLCLRFRRELANGRAKVLGQAVDKLRRIFEANEWKGIERVLELLGVSAKHAAAAGLNINLNQTLAPPIVTAGLYCRPAR